MVEKDVWLDLVTDLRSAQVCGTIGSAPPIKHNDPSYNRIHQEVKDQVVLDFRGWISTHECEGEHDERRRNS